MTRTAACPLRTFLAVPLLAVLAAGLVTPAVAGVDYTQYPTAVAANAAEMMAKFGGVVIDVETRFPGENRAISHVGCSAVKRDPQLVLSEGDRAYNFTHCAPDLTIERTFTPGNDLPTEVPVDTIEVPTDYVPPTDYAQ
jgi:hypothetical protein